MNKNNTSKYLTDTKNLIDFISECPDCFHTANAICKKLRENGYTELFETKDNNIKRGGKYTVLRNKVGVAVAPTRRSGGIQTLQSMIALFAQSQMIMPCGGAWPITSLGSMDTDAFSNDPEGVKIVDRLADNMMDVLEKLHRAR